MQPAIYILTNQHNGTLYIGMTTNLIRRVYEHRLGVVEGFSKKYRTTKLVYYELHERIEDAALRERQMKKWYRNWKIELIEKINPRWDDLYDTLT